MFDAAYLVVIFVLILLDIALIKLGVPVISILFGGVSIAVAASALSVEVPFSPWMQLLLAMTGSLGMFYGVAKARGY